MKEEKSYIFKVTTKDTIFICNRNNDIFKQLFYDKYVKFWETKEPYSMNLGDDDKLEILEILNVSNYKHKDQKLLNLIKLKYIADLNISDEEDRKIANKLFNEYIKNYRKKYKDYFDDFKSTLLEIKDLQNLIYSYSKKYILIIHHL